jgi:hypothetical protein
MIMFSFVKSLLTNMNNVRYINTANSLYSISANYCHLNSFF